MNRYSSLCDDFYVNMNLSTEMELPTSRETVLHYFERMQKKYPTMRNFYCRGKGRLRAGGGQGPGPVPLGHDRDPPRLLRARQPRDHRRRAGAAPAGAGAWRRTCCPSARWTARRWTCCSASTSPTAATTTSWWPRPWAFSPALEKLAEIPGGGIINYEPSLTLALDDECRMQCRLSIETRTSAYQIRTGDFPRSRSASTSRPGSTAAWGPTTTFVSTLENLSAHLPRAGRRTT